MNKLGIFIYKSSLKWNQLYLFWEKYVYYWFKPDLWTSGFHRLASVQNLILNMHNHYQTTIELAGFTFYNWRFRDGYNIRILVTQAGNLRRYQILSADRNGGGSQWLFGNSERYLARVYSRKMLTWRKKFWHPHIIWCGPGPNVNE